MLSIGVDIGGSSIKAALTEPGLQVIAELQSPSRSDEGPEAVLTAVVEIVGTLLKRAGAREVAGIGVGMPGTVDIAEGVVYHPPNFQDWDAVPLASALARRWDLPVRLDNDANCAALGEAFFGRGRSYEHFVGMTLGTGVGGGIIIGRSIYHGTRGFAGEIGHISIDYNGEQCNCGNRGCIEAYAGIGYLVRRALPLLQQDASSFLHERATTDPDSITPRHLSEAALQGDATAAAILYDTGTKLGCAVASAANLLDISTFIVGGGVAGAGDLIFAPMLLSAKARVLQAQREHLAILPAELGNRAGMLGAAALLASPQR